MSTSLRTYTHGGLCVGLAPERPAVGESQALTPKREKAVVDGRLDFRASLVNGQMTARSVLRAGIILDSV